MNKNYFFYAYWLIPMYLLFLVVQQGLVYQGTIDTYENGTSYIAEVTDFDIKQIAAQSNGYVDIRFQADEEVIERRLSLSVQMAQQLMQSSNIPIRYQKGAFQEIVLFPIYNIQKSTSLYNMGIAFIALLITLGIGLFVNRYVKSRIQQPDMDNFNIERVD